MLNWRAAEYPAAGTISGKLGTDMDVLRRQLVAIRALQERNTAWEAGTTGIGDNVVATQRQLETKYAERFRKSVLGKLDQQRDFITAYVTEAEIGADRPMLTLSADGETMRMETPLRYRIRPKALRLIVPARLPIFSSKPTTTTVSFGGTICTNCGFDSKSQTVNVMGVRLLHASLR